MRSIRNTFIAALLVCPTGMAIPAYARDGHGGGHFSGGHFGGHFHRHHFGPRFGFFIGPGLWPWYDPWWYGSPYYQPYYYPPAIAVPSSPPVYIERGQSSDWYYCWSPQGYYPYVKECPGGWQRVSPQPSARP